jgi:ketosteroid isomerase-like protein
LKRFRNAAETATEYAEIAGEPMQAREVVEQTLLSMAQAVSAGDFNTWRSLWHPDAREFAPNTPPAIGRTNLLYRAETWFKEWAHDMAIQCEEVHVAGNWAFASGSLALRSVSRREKKAHLLAGQFLAVLTELWDGRWLLYRYCYNSCVPLAGERCSPNKYSHRSREASGQGAGP